MLELTGSEDFTSIEVNGMSFSAPQAAVDEIERLRGIIRDVLSDMHFKQSLSVEEEKWLDKEVELVLGASGNCDKGKDDG